MKEPLPPHWNLELACFPIEVKLARVNVLKGVYVSYLYFLSRIVEYSSDRRASESNIAYIQPLFETVSVLSHFLKRANILFVMQNFQKAMLT